MLAVIHFAYLSKYLLIIEAPRGLGKKTAIEYFKKWLNLNDNNNYDCIVHLYAFSNFKSIKNLFTNFTIFFCRTKIFIKKNI